VVEKRERRFTGTLADRTESCFASWGVVGGIGSCWRQTIWHVSLAAYYWVLLGTILDANPETDGVKGKGNKRNRGETFPNFYQILNRRGRLTIGNRTRRGLSGHDSFEG